MPRQKTKAAKAEKLKPEKLPDDFSDLATGSCDNCGCDLFEDEGDDPDLCDQCDWYLNEAHRPNILAPQKPKKAR